MNHSRSNFTIGIVGLGEAARRIHIPAYRKVKRLRIVGGTDTDVRAAGFSFPLFPDLATLLREARPDIVAVATPPATHFDLARGALLGGAHVLCEKPFVPEMAQADALIALARQCDRRIVVNNQYRFMNLHRRARMMIGSPAFGKLQFASIEQTFRVSPHTEAGWRGAERRRTGQEFGIHALDLCRYFFGEDPKTLRCRMPRGDHPDGPDLLNLIELEFSGDRFASITLDRLCRGRTRYLDIRLDGTAGCIETRMGGHVEFGVGVRGGSRRPFLRHEVTLGGRADLWQGERSRRIASDPLDVMAHATAALVEAMLDALVAGRVPECDAADNRRSLALMLAAYRSHDAAGLPVPLEY